MDLGEISQSRPPGRWQEESRRDKASMTEGELGLVASESQSSQFPAWGRLGHQAAGPRPSIHGDAEAGATFNAPRPGPAPVSEAIDPNMKVDGWRMDGGWTEDW